MTDDTPDRIRVVYREVTQDLPNGSMHFGDEESLEFVVDEIHEGRIRGHTDDGLDVVVWRGGRKDVRVREADSGPFSTKLGSRQRFERVGLASFDDLSYGDEIRYIGPNEVDGEYVTPADWKQPYQFQSVSVGGTLSCLTKFNGQKRLAPEHPCNDPAAWERVE